MKTRKILSMFLTLVLLLALLPTAAFATGTEKAIRLVDKRGATPVAANIAGAQASSVYFGTYPQSPGENDDNAAVVGGNGNVARTGFNVDAYDAGVRPAFNINLNSVLFTSAAEGGKAGEGALAKVDDYSGSDWKLTLLDDGSENAVGNGHKDFKAEIVGTDGDPWKWKIQYSGARSGENEYISAVIKGNNTDGYYGVLYYGRLCKAQADPADPEADPNTITVDLSDMPLDDYDPSSSGWNTLHLFNEQYNGDYKTDYASGLQQIKVPTIMTLEAETVAVGEDAVIRAYLPDWATGTVTLTVNGTLYTVETVDGRAVLTISGLGAGTYTVEASYSGDDNFTGCTASAKLTVLAAAPISVTAKDAHIGEQTQITVNYPADADTSMTGIPGHPAGLITILIDDMVIDTLNGENGVLNYSVNIDSGFSEGTHTIGAVFNGDGKYSCNSASTSFNVLPPVEYPLWVGGVQVTSANKGDITAAITAAGGTASGSAAYDPDSNTLTLTDFSYTGLGYNFSSTHYTAFYYSSTTDLTIEFSGVNSITQSDCAGTGKGMYFVHPLANQTDSNNTIIFHSANGGTLNVTGGSSTGFESYGIEAAKVHLVISGGTINATGGSAKYRSYGVLCSVTSTLTVDGGTLNAVGGNAASDRSRGVYCSGDYIAVKSGKLTASGATSGIDKSRGIEGVSPEETTVSVTGGELIATGLSQANLDTTLSVGEGMAAKGSVTGNEADAVPYAAADNDSYKWIKIEKLPEYNITVIPGANMTKVATSGAVSQTVTAGSAIADVVYTAADGYYFPTDYTVAAVNGVTVTRDSYTQITVSGTPAADADIALTAPTSKAKEATPTATFTATGPDTGTLTGVTAGMSYAIDGGAAVNITGTTVDLTGLAACTITVIQPGNGTTTVDSDPQSFTVTKAETPSLTATQPTVINGTGSIPTTAGHEFSEDGASWTACTGETTGLAAGTYYIRVKAASATLASGAQTITINAFVPAKESTPAATLSITIGDDGKLVGVGPGMQYSFDGVNWTDITEDGISIADLKPGTLYIKKLGNGTTTVDSDPQAITITKAEAPVLTATDADDEDGSGSIIPTTAAHEISSDGGKTWRPCTGPSKDLEPGTYLVRVAAAGTALASEPVTVTIKYEPTYTILNGEGSSWTEGSGEQNGIEVRCSGKYKEFIGIQVDGKDVDKSLYSSREGSTIVTLPSAYLKTLAKGDHTLTFMFKYGTAGTTFNVIPAAAAPDDELPPTGDSGYALWIVMASAAIIVMFGTMYIGRKRRNS